MRKFFDQLHQVTTNELSLPDALELMVFCNHEGQIDLKSDFETRLCEDLRKQLLTKIQKSKELCLVWMYLRLWGPSGRECNLKTEFIDYLWQDASFTSKSYIISYMIYNNIGDLSFHSK